MPSLTSNEHISHLPPVSVLSSPNHRACHPAADKVTLLTSAGGRGDEEKGLKWSGVGERMQGSYKTCRCCSDLHHGCRRQRWDVEHSACWGSAHTVLSAVIVPAIGDLFHCLPFAFPLMMGAKVFKNAAWWRRSAKATSFSNVRWPPRPLQNWRADNRVIARGASWTVCTMLQFKLANLINSWQVEKNATEMTFPLFF